MRRGEKWPKPRLSLSIGEIYRRYRDSLGFVGGRRKLVWDREGEFDYSLDSSSCCCGGGRLE